ncbi:carboxylic ester hydrolase [Aureococcus anophagefferens]|nr:carboxylic ester hydrolase [Aureococcus anophagefferens]
MLLGGFASIALALASVSPDVLPPNALPPNALPNADASLPAPKALKPCRGESDCISSAGTESPNHFQAPLALGAGGRAAAYRGAVARCARPAAPSAATPRPTSSRAAPTATTSSCS